MKTLIKFTLIFFRFCFGWFTNIFEPVVESLAWFSDAHVFFYFLSTVSWQSSHLWIRTLFISMYGLSSNFSQVASLKFSSPNVYVLFILFVTITWVGVSSWSLSWLSSDTMSTAAAVVSADATSVEDRHWPPKNCCPHLWTLGCLQL